MGSLAEPRAARSGALGRAAGRPIERAIHRAIVFAEATKLRSVVLLGFVGLAAGVWALRAAPAPAAPETWSPFPSGAARLALGTLAVVLGSMGANAITGAIDHHMDSIMTRTKHRPIPTGRLTVPESFWFGVSLVLLGVLAALLTGHVWSSVWVLLGALDVTLLYNGWSKPRTPWSVVLGSPAGGAPVLVTVSAVTGAALDPASLLLAALVVVWTPIHVWSLAIRYVDDYRSAGVPMLPVAVGVRQASRCVAWATVGLCALAALLPGALHLPGWLAAAVLGLQAPLLAASVATALAPTAERSWLLFKLSSPYLALLFAAVALAA